MIEFLREQWTQFHGNTHITLNLKFARHKCHGAVEFALGHQHKVFQAQSHGALGFNIVVTDYIGNLSGVENNMALIAETRGVTVESLAGFRSMVWGYLSKQSPENIEVWASKQTYIALGTAMVSAASQQIDATPMEGFSAPAVNEILELDKYDLHASVILALGYRDSNIDPLASANKVRRPIHKLIDFI